MRLEGSSENYPVRAKEEADNTESTESQSYLRSIYAAFGASIEVLQKKLSRAR